MDSEKQQADSPNTEPHKTADKLLTLKLFAIFFKIGAFTFGGGYAMIPIIERETAEKRDWINKDELIDIIAVSESTPGPIAINSATFIGYRKAGLPGSICATLGVVLPSFIIILLISTFLSQFANYKGVIYAFNGIRAGVLALIVKALWSMAQKFPKDIPSIVIALLAFIFAAFTEINILFIIIGCALLGSAVYFFAQRRARKG